MVSSRFGPLVALCALEEAAGHGWVSDPPARNDQAGDMNVYCPHCGNGNGICGDTIDTTTGQWPASSKYVDFYQGPVASWTEGSIVSVDVRVTAHHKGHYEFSVCDQVINSGLSNAQACLDKHILLRASAEEAGIMDCVAGDERAVCQPIDPRHPERYYLPPDSAFDKVYLKLPAGLTCESCTMQWRWWTANSCIPATDYACFKSELDAAGYNSGGFGLTWASEGGSCPGGSCDRCGCGEEFRNCIDVSITSSGGSPAPVPTSPAPTTTTRPLVTSTAAPATTTQLPTSPPSMCRAVPGNNFGATEDKCNKACSYIPYGQFPCEADGPCVCGEAPQPQPTPVVTPSPTPVSTPAAGGGQCGSCKGCLWTEYGNCFPYWSETVCNYYIGSGYQWCA